MDNGALCRLETSIHAEVRPADCYITSVWTSVAEETQGPPLRRGGDSRRRPVRERALLAADGAKFFIEPHYDAFRAILVRSPLIDLNELEGSDQRCLALPRAAGARRTFERDAA